MARIIFRIILGIVVFALVAGLLAGAAAMIFRAGVSQGLVQSGKLALPQNGQPGGVAPYSGFYPYYYHPFGFMFPFGLIPLFLGILFFVFIIPRLFFFGRMGHGWGMHGRFGHHGQDPDQVPPMLEEWHKRLHNRPDEQTKTGS